jgi:toxin ParE1/3/4
VSNFRLSRRAEEDFLQIGAFTIDRWGVDQANRYLNQLETCCRQIADMPAMGRPANEVRPDLRRIEHGRHVIFYRELSDGVLIVRILHHKMLAEHQTFDDEE